MPTFKETDENFEWEELKTFLLIMNRHHGYEQIASNYFAFPEHI